MTDLTSRLSTALADRYKIERHLGEGGMATVYLAEDLKHKRKVAVKVLRPELAAVLGAERFVQEITTTANLQHPHILPLFDSGEADSFLYYVMPFIDGETLRDKLNRETQLGIEEAVSITTDIADALDYAHQQGVIHRDIKPENILLHNGRPMVADFGIALAVSAAAGGRMTETGLSLGTPHYMSPEQATAEKDLTNRSDIYSLGSVLYEMLTGEPPHVGGSAQAIIMKIVTDDARPVTELRKSVPPHVAAATAKSLERLAADRFESAAKFAEALTDPAFTLPTTQAAAVKGAPAADLWKRVSVGVAAIASLLAVALALQMLTGSDSGRAVARFLVSVPDDRPLGLALLNGVEIAPDGSRLAYIGVGEDGNSRVFVRDFDSFEVRPVAGSENVDEFAFSPDGSEIAVRVGMQLRRTGWAGEAPRTIADSVFLGPVWGRDGLIYYTDPQGTLVRIPATGGREEVLLVEDPNFGYQTWADILPDGRGGIVVTRRAAVQTAADTIRIVDFSDRTMRALTPGIDAFHRSGRVIFVKQDGSLWAAPFDLDRLDFEQEPIAVLEGLQTGTALGTAQFSVAANGTLLYAPASRDGYPPVRVSRDGTEAPYDFTFPFEIDLRVSPEGTRLAAALVDASGADIHVIDLVDGTKTRLTFDGQTAYAAWSGDGRRVAYYSLVDSVYEIHWRVADGSAPAERLVGGPGIPIEIVFVPGERSFITREGDRSRGDNADLMLYEPSGDSLIRTPLTRTPWNERSPMISPDGKFVAYVSDERGRDEVYVRETQPSENRWQVSNQGGREPLWAHNGGELFFQEAGQLVRVGVRTEPTFAVTEPAEALFPVGAYLQNYNHTSYGILPGDDEFIFARVASSRNRLVVVLNWLDEVSEMLEGGR